MGKIHPRRKENGQCLPAGSWMQPTCLKPVTDHSEGHQVRKGGWMGGCLPDAMDRAGGVSEGPRGQVQGAGGHGEEAEWGG